MENTQKYEALGWPTRERIMNPKGAGAQVTVELAKRKIERTLLRRTDVEGVEVGILSNNPETSEAPLAIVCEFPRPVSDETLFHAQKLAWNFSRSLLLVTVEPHIVRKWSCCEHPVDIPEWRRQKGASLDDAALDTPHIQPSIPFGDAGECKNEEAARSLHWIELTSGHFFEQQPGRFPLDKRADRMLLKNLKEVRNLLGKIGLENRFSHDLLARIIFVQFLFDRRDSQGRAALNKEQLRRLYESGRLSQPYEDLESTLRNYEDAYALFERLNERFNGDLFPGDSRHPGESKAEWEKEKEHVTAEHLRCLADFVSGKIEFDSGQRCLWPLYAFDAIPLEFISSIYEEFVSKEEGTGVHYTPGHLVDFMLDRVLPWSGDEWDLRVLDPACGSGIFLVKAYQRLIYRWKQAHPHKEQIPSAVLQKLLEENLFGVDRDADAARVASFSLYLAMCDEIDPRRYWANAMTVKFPQLRGRRILCTDFFSSGEELTQGGNLPKFDLVIGNPPFGKNTLGSASRKWLRANDRWSVPNNDIGTLFLAKAAEVASPNGKMCMVQSASVLLSMRGSTGMAHRRKVFLGFVKVRSVTNLAAFRPFRDVNEPTCILELENEEPDPSSRLRYECPKRTKTSQDAHHVIIEPHDVNWLYPQEIVDEPWVLSALMWGGQRDRMLIKRLTDLPTAEELENRGVLETRRGIIRGRERELEIEELYGRRLFETPVFPSLDEENLYLDTDSLPVVESEWDARVYSRSSTNFDAFETPQLLLKMSWVKEPGRYQARLIKSDRGVICSRAHITVHDKQAKSSKSEVLEAACLAYNSQLANYYFFMTSARFAFDHRPEPTKSQLLTIPLPSEVVPSETEDSLFKKKPAPERRIEATTEERLLDGISSLEEIDRRTFDLYDFSEADSILIEDMVTYTLASWKNLDEAPGRGPTIRRAENGSEEPDLWSYCEVLRQVLESGYGSRMSVRATVFTEKKEDPLLPIRLIAVCLSNEEGSSVEVKGITSGKLRRRLAEVQKLFGERANQYNYHQRCVRSFEYREKGEKQELVAYLLKPDQMRYWTRSMAMRDADAIAADLRTWHASSSQRTVQEEAVPA